MPQPRLDELFLLHLPRIEAHASCALRHVRCEDTRADMAAEVVALAWRHFVRLALRGKRPEEFVTTLALRCSQVGVGLVVGVVCLVCPCWVGAVLATGSSAAAVVAARVGAALNRIFAGFRLA